MQRTSGFGTAIAVAVTLVVPLVAAGVLTLRASSESPLQAAADVAPVVGSVERAERFGETQVTIAVKSGESRGPVTQASGTVTALSLAPGQEVTTGTVLATVDAGQVIGYVSASPLYRDIARGMSGADVRTAQELLVAFGYNPGTVDAKAGSATERAIRAFNKDHGWGDDNTTLSLASLVWIGTSPATVGTVALHLGDSVSPGSKVFDTQAGAASIIVKETAGVPKDAAMHLTVAGVTVPYTAGSGAITDADDVAAIISVLGTMTEGAGTLRLAEPTVVGSVPASAVIADPSGVTCIFPSVEGAAVQVSPIGGTLGTVDLDASMIGQAVVVNPRDVREDLTCGS